MTESLFRQDAYLKSCDARVSKVTADGIALDRTVFYPRGGGQPGDTGVLRRRAGPDVEIVDTHKGEGDDIVHVPSADAPAVEVGEELTAEIDWDRRYLHMRMHTCLHLLGAVLRYGVTGGAITTERSRLDFDMQETIDKEEVTKALNALIREDHTVQTRWITDAELAERPELIRTMSVRPPEGAGTVRLLEIPGVDLQPCGGTHVAHTAEIGEVRIGKVEKKGRRNRRVHVLFA